MYSAHIPANSMISIDGGHQYLSNQISMSLSINTITLYAIMEAMVIHISGMKIQGP